MKAETGFLGTCAPKYSAGISFRNAAILADTVDEDLSPSLRASKAVSRMILAIPSFPRCRSSRKKLLYKTLVKRESTQKL